MDLKVDTNCPETPYLVYTSWEKEMNLTSSFSREERHIYTWNLSSWFIINDNNSK